MIVNSTLAAHLQIAPLSNYTKNANESRTYKGQTAAKIPNFDTLRGRVIPTECCYPTYLSLAVNTAYLSIVSLTTTPRIDERWHKHHKPHQENDEDD
jgi:hypothetical protein